jgi:hypothetical protein
MGEVVVESHKEEVRWTPNKEDVRGTPNKREKKEEVLVNIACIPLEQHTRPQEVRRSSSSKKFLRLTAF